MTLLKLPAALLMSLGLLMPDFAAAASVSNAPAQITLPTIYNQEMALGAACKKPPCKSAGHSKPSTKKSMNKTTVNKATVNKKTVNKNTVNKTDINVNKKTNVNVNVNHRVRPVGYHPVYRSWYHRPYYGSIVAGVTLGTIIVVTAASVPPAYPSNELCWYWSNSSQTRGYWDYCY